MSFKIYWLNVSKCCTQELVLEKLHRLKVLLQADDLDIKYNTYSGNTKNEIIHMRNYLRKILEQSEFRESLIVLTDVQDENIIKAFDLHCKIFVTTRHIEKLEYIPKKSKTTINIDTGFTHPESLELFRRAFNENLPADMNTYIESFHNISKGHPFIMSLIAKTFQNFNEDEKDRKTRCDRWLKNLNEYKLQDKDNQVKMSVEESLKFLSIQNQICYKKMVIFTDNSDIPFEVLSKIWDTDPQQTEDIVLKLSNYSLIERPMTEDNDKACSLHYLHFHFLKQHVSKSDQEIYHRHLVDMYEVDKTMRDRIELDLNFPDDNYFHYFIPNHFVGAKRYDLFELYLDFGFLEQKMRLTKLPNTVGDLIRFHDEITNGHPEKIDFHNELISFLTQSERLLVKSADVNLLQLALTSSDLVKMKAEELIQKFPDRVWMNDLNHGENQTQIVQLASQSLPQLVRFVKPNDNLVCLISLQDNNILLHDISLDYPDEPVLYRNDLPNSIITDMQVFRNYAFLTLNDLGKLVVYTLKHSPLRKASMPSRAVTSKSIETNANKIVQKLDGGADKFTCFNVFEFQPEGARSDTDEKIDLMVGTVQGNIKFYQWKVNKFEQINRMSITTNFNDLFRMAHIETDSETRQAQHEYVMLLNTHGEIKFINLISSSEIFSTKPSINLGTPINLHQGICGNSKLPCSICVSKDKVVQVTHQPKLNFTGGSLVDVEYDDLFVASDDFDDNKILSSTMSKDAEYLILGTTKGIIVIDRFNRKVIFRRNVSDQVLSLDIYRYHDEALYILSSVFKDAGHMIGLYGFNDNREELAMMKEMTFFVGEDLFDINKAIDGWQMIAVDTKRNIHFLSFDADGTTESFEKVSFQFQVKRICYQGDKVIVGCTSGAVFSTDHMSQTMSLATLTSEITYLECFGDKIVASCNGSFKIIGIARDFYGKVIKAYRYKDNQLLLVKKNCTIEIINAGTGACLMSRMLADDISCSAQAYCDGLVAIGTIADYVHVWKIEDDPEANFELKSFKSASTVTSLAISADKSVLAIGCANGVVEVRYYNLSIKTKQSTYLIKKISFTQIVNLGDMTLMQQLESHKLAVMNLIFSPWVEPNDPLILLSLSGSVNFWNIRSIQNNPLEMKKKQTPGRLRVSQRFKSPLKTVVNITADLLTATENLKINGAANPWHNKTGASDKPELLSCIKLVAKSAKKIICNDEFTRFVTIDNEGNIYHLRMIEDALDRQLTVDFNGNPLITLQ